MSLGLAAADRSMLQRMVCAGMTEHTRFPMLVPTPTASYNACYSRDYLVHAATLPLPPELGYLMGILYTISDVAARGYCVLVLQYLFEACQGPRAGHGSRTCLYGLQTPPLGQHTLMRISETAAGNSVSACFGAQVWSMGAAAMTMRPLMSGWTRCWCCRGR